MEEIGKVVKELVLKKKLDPSVSANKIQQMFTLLVTSILVKLFFSIKKLKVSKFILFILNLGLNLTQKSDTTKNLYTNSLVNKDSKILNMLANGFQLHNKIIIYNGHVGFSLGISIISILWNINIFHHIYKKKGENMIMLLNSLIAVWHKVENS